MKQYEITKKQLVTKKRYLPISLFHLQYYTVYLCIHILFRIMFDFLQEVKCVSHFHVTGHAVAL